MEGNTKDNFDQGNTLSQHEAIIIDGVSKNETIKEITENPEKFISWFENLKDSISTWPEKFFTEKTFRNAILIAAIPFAVLKAGQMEASAEEVGSTSLDTPVISKTIEASPQKIKPEELILLENEQDREIVAQRINYELEVFDKLSEPFNAAVGAPVFNFGGRIKAKIDESNRFASSLLSVNDLGERINMGDKEANKILKNGQLNFIELAKVLPESLIAAEAALIVHELGHQTEAYKQGAISSSVSINLLSGYTEYHGNIQNKAAFSAAGINADKAYGEFITDSLRGKDAPGQFLAIMALAAKSNGVYYALSTKWSEPRRNLEGNDIVSYAKETNTSITDLAIGLTADFLLNSDNWHLLKTALGEGGVKIPDSTLALTYELGARGPVTGIKYKSLF